MPSDYDDHDDDGSVGGIKWCVMMIMVVEVGMVSIGAQ